MRELGLLGAKQLVEQRAIAEERRAQILRARRAARVPDRDLVRRAVIFDQLRVLYRNIGGALLESLGAKNNHRCVSC